MGRTAALLIVAGIAVASMIAPALSDSGVLEAQLQPQNQTIDQYDNPPYDNIEVTSSSIYAYDPAGVSDEVFVWVYLACRALGGRMEVLHQEVGWTIWYTEITINRVPVAVRCLDW
jgi:hypothetical protein